MEALVPSNSPTPERQIAYHLCAAPSPSSHCSACSAAASASRISGSFSFFGLPSASFLHARAWRQLSSASSGAAGSDFFSMP